MNKRPILVTIIGFLFIVAGTVGIVYHAGDFKNLGVSPELIWVLLIRLLAIIGGLFVLRGQNWARWLLVTWMAYHAVLSFFHTPLEFAIHVLFLALASYALFNSHVSGYFLKQ